VLKGLYSLILEAFAQYLQSADAKTPATEVLARWLWEKLSAPSQTPVDKVLQCEIHLALTKASSYNGLPYPERLHESHQRRKNQRPAYVFRGASPSGSKLLKLLYEYCLSYEQQKWSRWVHSLKASDFNGWR
jgi:hypothetical protein